MEEKNYRKALYVFMIQMSPNYDAILGFQKTTVGSTTINGG
jgi:hypothetical protein